MVFSPGCMVADPVIAPTSMYTPSVKALSVAITKATVLHAAAAACASQRATIRGTMI
ncbi:hypothetical protein [Rhodococcus qingshengii]|uniref:hypothetical protein n=1 Tax=Rhodococcus qingshengii TaxID=334542 RepID=UPI001C21D323|nr:hypothetical protein [Rhodococcus qingshengii]QXC46495.1 hypothetical protein KSE96_30045 [Rhodococcus qingshengii]